MASKVKTVKTQTVEKIKKFKNEFPNLEEFKTTEKYQNFIKTFLNSVEKEYADDIIKMVYDGKTYAEVKEFINEKTSEKIDEVFADADSDTKDDDKTMDEVNNEAAETFFMLTKGKVVEVEPVSVLIGDDDQEQNKETSKPVKDEGKHEVKNDNADSETFYMPTKGKVVDIQVDKHTDGNKDVKSEENIAKKTENPATENVKQAELESQINAESKESVPMDKIKGIIRGALEKVKAERNQNIKITDASVTVVYKSVDFFERIS